MMRKWHSLSFFLRSLFDGELGIPLTEIPLLLSVLPAPTREGVKGSKGMVLLVRTWRKGETKFSLAATCSILAIQRDVLPSPHVRANEGMHRGGVQGLHGGKQHKKQKKKIIE